MTREEYAKELIKEHGRTGAIKSLQSSIESWETNKGTNKPLKFFSDTLEIVRTN